MPGPMYGNYIKSIDNGIEATRQWMSDNGIMPESLPDNPWKLPPECPLWHLALSFAQASWILLKLKRPVPKETPMILNSGTIKGMLTRCTEKDWYKAPSKEVELTWEVRSSDDHATTAYTPPADKVFQLIGGPTGYESFYLEPKNVQFHEFVDWCACAGTYLRWDRLVIPAAEMRRVFQEAGLLTQENS